MQRTSRKSRALRFEALERRAMLAGDVTVSIVNHDLVVHSDDGDDSIVVGQSSAGEFQVQGVNGTTINGQSTAFSAQGINNISIVMGNGNDSVAVEGFQPIVVSEVIGGGQPPIIPLQPPQNIAIAGNLSIVMGGGTDTVNVTYASIAKGLSIVTGNGNDQVELFAAHVANDTDIRTGDGNDTVSIAGVAYPNFAPTPNTAALTVIYPLHPLKTVPVTPTPVPVSSARLSTIGGDLEITTGNGTDSVSVNDAVVSGNATIVAGQGSDNISLGQTMTPLEPFSPLSLQLPIITLAGYVNIVGALTIVAGDGGNHIGINGATAGSIIISTGAGNDDVTLSNATADAFFASLGAGNDTLDTSGGANTITSFVAFGGGGSDTFLGNVSNIFKHEFLFLFGHIS